MTPEINALLNTLESSSAGQDGDDTVEEATLCLKLLLEISSNPDCKSMARDNRLLLPDDLQAVSLSNEDQRPLITRVCNLIRITSNKRRPGLFWLLSASLFHITIVPLVITINDISNEIDEASAGAAIGALDMIMFRDCNDALLTQHRAILKQCNLLGFLEKWSTSPTVARIGGFVNDLERLRRGLT